MPADNILSHLNSPSESFRVPQWTPLSQGASINDFVAAASESSRTSTSTSAREACALTGLPNSSASSSFRLSKDAAPVAAKRPCSSLYRNLSGTRYLSKLGSRRLFGRQNSESRAYLRTAGRCNQTLLLENGQSSQESGSQQAGDAKQSMTLSQLVASSKREVFGWSDVNSLSQISWNIDEDGLDECMPLPVERIRVAPSQAADSGATDSDSVLQKCGLCSRYLLHRSPWSSQRLLGSNDFPGVGVLVCGHVFHTDCLEKAVPDTLKHDPPCPQCDQTENAALKALVLKFDDVKDTMKPFKNKLARMRPQFQIKSLFNVKSALPSMKADGDMQTLPSSVSGREKGVLLRSLSKLQFPLRVKSIKDSGAQNLGPAQVSPDQT